MIDKPKSRYFLFNQLSLLINELSTIIMIVFSNFQNAIDYIFLHHKLMKIGNCYLIRADVKVGYS